MAKNKGSKVASFGSRKGTVRAAVVRGNTVKFNKEIDGWFEELETLSKEASAMPAAGLIVTSYINAHGKKVADPAALNASVLSFKTVVENHNEAVANLKVKLEELREKRHEVSRDNLRLQTLDWAIKLQDVMNDFGSIGMFAIDRALDPFRVLSETDESVPFPGYMIKTKPTDVSIVDQHGDETGKVTDMVILDVPKEEAEAEPARGEVDGVVRVEDSVLYAAKEVAATVEENKND